MTNRFFKPASGGWAFFLLLIFSLAFLADAFAGSVARYGMQQQRYHHGMGHLGQGICPQSRTTVQAPDEFLKMKNPLKPDPDNLFAGESFFQTDAQPTACKVCHGIVGNGMGMMAPGLDPPPRNFTCAETMQEISDGQLFWAIKNGLLDSGMPSYKSLQDEQVWQIVLYLRTLSE